MALKYGLTVLKKPGQGAGPKPTLSLFKENDDDEVDASTSVNHMLRRDSAQASSNRKV